MPHKQSSERHAFKYKTNNLLNVKNRKFHCLYRGFCGFRFLSVQELVISEFVMAPILVASSADLSEFVMAPILVASSVDLS